MAAVKREMARASSAKAEQPRVKAERDPGLALAMRLSLQQSQKVKAEKREPLKAEASQGVKAEQRTSAKPERSAGVKAERAAPAVAGGQQLPPLSAKVEQLRKLGIGKIKAELLKQSQEEDTADSAGDLLKRGLQIRAKQNRVKREQGSGKKGPKFIKVKKERCRNKDGSLRKKPRVTAKRRKASREAMNREVVLSGELSDLLGSEALSRPEAVRQLWSYCRDNDMLNPENRREIQFDAKLETMMGTKTATLPQLTSLLMPHFDYSSTPVKQEMKHEPGHKTKIEAKKEQKQIAKREMKQEKPAPPTRLEAKREQKIEPAASVKRLKQEPAPRAVQADGALARRALGGTVPQLARFDRNSAVIECLAPPGQSQLVAVASPVGSAGAPLRAACTVEFRETKEGALEPCAEARFASLDPALAYNISVQLADVPEVRSQEIVLPQRAQPAKWSPRDVLAWCQAQHVPELLRMAQDYAVDGATLMSMGEEDLKASGMVAPFLLRRTLAGLAVLRAAGS